MTSLAQRWGIGLTLSVGLSVGLVAGVNRPAQAESRITIGTGVECVGSYSGLSGDGLCTYERVNGEGVPYNYYDGRLVNGQPEGRGVLVYSNGDRYEGNFVNGLPNGTGMFLYENGDRYEGTFQNGRFNGRGEFTYAEGDHYVGSFSDGQPHGRGTFFYAETNASYSGEFKYGQAHGNGVTQSNGVRCEGWFFDSTLNGNVTCSYPSNSMISSYVGEVRGGLANGRGVRTWINGQRFEGQFVNDVFVRNDR
ncbi:MAG: hypothetical protein MUF49_03385 [Oculatellaceae cyanobacterium Prado106]|nr:hypothetical protein [Oculatellaceae cyanobacterium Prado106]